jgi:cobyric acid synthase
LPDIPEIDYYRMQEDAIDRLADEMEATLDIDRIVSFLG